MTSSVAIIMCTSILPAVRAWHSGKIDDSFSLFAGLVHDQHALPECQTCTADLALCSGHFTSFMDNMSALDQALDILPFSVKVDDRAVKEAVITQLAQELCSALRQAVPRASFDVSEEIMKQTLASALIVTQQKVIANPPTFVKIARKYQRRASAPALSNVSNMSNGPSVVSNPVSNGSSCRAGSPEVSSNNLSGPGSSASAGSIGVADFMDPEVLKTAKLWRCQKLSKAELVGLVEHYTKVTPSATSTKVQLIKALMDFAATSL